MTEVTHTTKRRVIDRVMDKSIYLNALLLAGVVAFAFLYIGQINRAASTGFRLNELQANIGNLRIANQQLEYRAAENRAMYNVSRRVSVLGMVRPNEISYVSTDIPTVALGN